MDFETRVLPVVERFARQRFGKDESRVQDAIGLCWYRYQQTPNRQEVAAEAFAGFAVKQVQCGRDIPPKTKADDAMDSRRYWQGADMSGASLDFTQYRTSASMVRLLIIASKCTRTTWPR